MGGGREKIDLGRFLSQLAFGKTVVPVRWPKRPNNDYLDCFRQAAPYVIQCATSVQQSIALMKVAFVPTVWT